MEKPPQLQSKIENLGNPDLAKNKEIYKNLSSPEFVKMFPSPGDFQYDLLRESLISSKENALHGIAFLQDFLKKTDNPLFCLVKFSKFLRIAIGHQKTFSQDAEQKEISKILEKGFQDISSDEDLKYFLGLNLKPEVVLSETHSFEQQEKGLTPIHVSEEYFIQDNEFDPIPVFYHTKNPAEFRVLLDQQKELFQSARPENKPEINRNVTLEEMLVYKNKYLDSVINFDKKQQEIQDIIKKTTHILEPKQIQEFFPMSKNTFELTQDPMLFEFRAFVNPEIRSAIEKEFGISLKDIPLKEQMFFLTSITNRTNKTIKSVQEFTKKFKRFGLRTFLSVEHGGPEMGDKIIELAEKLPQSSTDILFSKYGEIIDEVYSVSEHIKETLGEKATPEIIEKTKELLLVKGKNLLLEYADKAVTCTDKDCTDLGKILEEKIADIKVSTLAFGSVCKSLVSSGEFNFDDFKDVELVYESVVSEKNQQEIMKMAEENTKQYPEKLKEYWRGTAREALDNPDEKQRIVNVKLKGEVIASMRVIDKGNGLFYGASFNVNPNIRGSRVGTELLHFVIENYTKDGTFVADVYDKNPMLETYITEFGFEVIGIVENYHDTETTILLIEKK